MVTSTSMARITKKQLAKALGRLKTILGPAGDNLALDHNSYFGGWKIVERTLNSEGDIFGAKRRSASEMLDVINFAIEVNWLREERGYWSFPPAGTSIECEKCGERMQPRNSSWVRSSGIVVHLQKKDGTSCGHRNKIK